MQVGRSAVGLIQGHGRQAQRFGGGQFLRHGTDERHFTPGQAQRGQAGSVATGVWLGAFQVASGSSADYDKGELMRYLSELPVYPDAILNLRGGVAADRRQDHVGDSPICNGRRECRFIFDEAGVFR